MSLRDGLTAVNDAGCEATAERRQPSLRPRPSASIILIDRQAGRIPRILVGKRASGHAFMPDLFVFPGGRRDPRDHALPFHQDLRPEVIDKLILSGAPRMTVGGARALALAAARELEEETGGRLDGRQTQRGWAPDLSSLRYVARAVTPTGAVRRFDNRFFATFIDQAGIDPGLLRESEELNELRWVDINDLESVKMPAIVSAVAGDLKISLELDGALPFGSPLVVYTNRGGQFLRSRL
jgi:8-oxo-dGTP pyrophosphatase MutT (NUDIX family)